MNALTGDDYNRDSRCEVCKLTPGLCLCDALPAIELPLDLLLIQHAEEIYKQSNTGSIVAASIPACRTAVHGTKEDGQAPCPLDPSV